MRSAVAVAGGARTVAAHCRCREGCLWPLADDDPTIDTPTGLALADHVLPPYPGDTLPLDFTETVR